MGISATAGVTDVRVGVYVLSRSLMTTSRFCGLVVVVVAVDDLGGNVVVEEPRDDLDTDEAEDEECEKQPGRFCGGYLGFF